LKLIESNKNIVQKSNVFEQENKVKTNTIESLNNQISKFNKSAIELHNNEFTKIQTELE